MKRIIATIVASILLAGVATAGLVSAQSAHFDTNETVTIGKAVAINGALYSAGETVTVDGSVDGDIFCGARDVIIAGDVTGDVICAGQTVHITGNVTGDIRAAGQTIIIDGTVSGSVTAFGESIQVGTDARIGRDLNGAGMTLAVRGEVARDVIFSGESVSVQGTVGRDLRGQYEQVSVLDTATVKGDAIFEANSVDIAPGTVAGVTEYEPFVTSQVNTFDDKMFRLISTAALVGLSFAFILIAPGTVRRATKVSAGRFWLSALLGLGLLIFVPIIAALLAATIIGMSFGAVILLLWGIMLYASLPLTSYYIGRAVMKQTSVKNSVAIMAVGVVIMIIATNLPWIGGFVMFIAALAGSGLGARAIIANIKKPVYTES